MTTTYGGEQPRLSPRGDMLAWTADGDVCLDSLVDEESFDVLGKGQDVRWIMRDRLTWRRQELDGRFIRLEADLANNWEPQVMDDAPSSVAGLVFEASLGNWATVSADRVAFLNGKPIGTCVDDMQMAGEMTALRMGRLIQVFRFDKLEYAHQVPFGMVNPDMSVSDEGWVGVAEGGKAVVLSPSGEHDVSVTPCQGDRVPVVMRLEGNIWVWNGVTVASGERAVAGRPLGSPQVVLVPEVATDRPQIVIGPTPDGEVAVYVAGDDGNGTITVADAQWTASRAIIPVPMEAGVVVNLLPFIAPTQLAARQDMAIEVDYENRYAVFGYWGGRCYHRLEWDDRYVYEREGKSFLSYWMLQDGKIMPLQWSPGDSFEATGQLAVKSQDKDIEQSTSVTYVSTFEAAYQAFDCGGSLGICPVVVNSLAYSNGRTDVNYYARRWGWFRRETYQNGELVSAWLFNETQAVE